MTVQRMEFVASSEPLFRVCVKVLDNRVQDTHEVGSLRKGLLMVEYMSSSFGTFSREVIKRLIISAREKNLQQSGISVEF